MESDGDGVVLPRSHTWLRTSAIIAFVVIGLAVPFLISSARLSLLALVWITAIVVLGMTFIISNTGLVSLGQAALTASGAYVLAILMNNLGVPFYGALVGAALAGGVVGLIYALPSVRVRGPYFAIVTIILGGAVPQIVNLASGVTGGDNGVYLTSPSFGPLTASASSYYLAFVLLVISLWFCANLQNSGFGRALRIIKAHPVAATAYGINVLRVQTVGVTVGNVLAGLGGGLLALHVGGVAPGNFTLDTSSYYLIGAVVGGSTSVFGAVVGAGLVEIVLNELAGAGYYANIVLGVVLVATLTFLPNGLVGLLGTVWNSVRSKWSNRWGIPAPTPPAYSAESPHVGSRTHPDAEKSEVLRGEQKEPQGRG